VCVGVGVCTCRYRCVSGPPGISVLKVTNSPSSFGKNPENSRLELITYLQANTFIIARK